ncbi:VF530 family protein [Runella slithyformis]|uniref:VF530 family protein n=1 Tax=Runella slithyformis TaxID=106 RepID=UPI00286E5E33|nr:VF530 family protein [Runella slithyformis]
MEAKQTIYRFLTMSLLLCFYEISLSKNTVAGFPMTVLSKFSILLYLCLMQNPQANNPLHGITLEMMLNHLVAHYGWETMSEYVNIRCFQYDPSIKSSLTFLRKTPWARAKVEQLYLMSLND